MNVHGVELNNEAFKVLRSLQSENSEMIELYLSAIDECEDLLLTPEGIVPDISDKKKLETLRFLHYLKNDLSTLISRNDE